MATTGMNGLYPPVFPQTFQPAFVLDEGRMYIYFNISNYNKVSDYFAWAQVDVRNQKTNESVVVNNQSMILYRPFEFNSVRNCYQMLIWTDELQRDKNESIDVIEGEHRQQVALKVD